MSTYVYIIMYVNVYVYIAIYVYTRTLLIYGFIIRKHEFAEWLYLMV